MIDPPVIHLFPLHELVYVEYKKKYQKGVLDHWVERCSILDLLFWESGWLYSSCHITIYMYLNDFFKKCYGENAPLFCTFILFFYIYVVLNCAVSHSWKQL